MAAPLGVGRLPPLLSLYGPFHLNYRSCMVCYVNDAPQQIADNQLLTDLLVYLGQLNFRGLAVAINDEVVPQGAWASRTVQPHDQVLLIRATQGG